jgi:hypothetical protein
MCWVRHRPPMLNVSWWGPLQWVNPLQPSIRSAGQSLFSLILCCCPSSGCNMGLLWFPSLSWWFIPFSWMTSLVNGTLRSSCRVWLVTNLGIWIRLLIYNYNQLYDHVSFKICGAPLWLQDLFILFICWAVVEPSPLLPWSFIGLLYQPRVIDCDVCGTISGVNEWEGKLKHSEETCPNAALSNTDPK